MRVDVVLPGTRFVLEGQGEFGFAGDRWSEPDVAYVGLHLDDATWRGLPFVPGRHDFVDLLVNRAVIIRLRPVEVVLQPDPPSITFRGQIL